MYWISSADCAETQAGCMRLSARTRTRNVLLVPRLVLVSSAALSKLVSASAPSSVIGRVSILGSAPSTVIG